MPVATAGPGVVSSEFIGRVRLIRRSITLCCGLAQDLEGGYYQELIAFILFLKRQTKAAFDFSSSAGRDKQFMVGGGLPSPTLR